MLSVSPIAIVAAAMAAYFLPGIAAVALGRRRQWVILALNFLLGWTLVGWIASAAWAFAGDKPRRPVPKPAARSAPTIVATARKAKDFFANDNADKVGSAAYAWTDDVSDDSYADWLESGAALAPKSAIVQPPSHEIAA